MSRLLRAPGALVQVEGQALAHEVVAEAAVRLLVGEGEPECLVDPACRHQHVVGPQRDLPVAGVASEGEARVDQAGADTEAASGRGDQQDPELGHVFLVAGDQEDASGAYAVDLGDPGGFPGRVVLGGVVGDDPGHQCLEVGVPAELLVVDLTVGHHHPAEVAGAVRRAHDDAPLLVLLRHGSPPSRMPDTTVPVDATHVGCRRARQSPSRRQVAQTGSLLGVGPTRLLVMRVVEANDLRRSYTTRTGVLKRDKKHVDAVKGVSFGIEKGELFGLLGPNGAGKTTTIKMLITLLLPTGGSASVLGQDVVDNPREVRRHIGYVFGGDRGLYERLSALDNLRYFAELYGVDPKVQRTRIHELLELVGLNGREKERVEGYSRGMRQRLHIARGILHDPPVVFLDEPTIGVDPVGARDLRQTIASLKAAGKTVLLTTHYMFEADDLCDRIAVIAKGEIVAEGTPRDLKAIVADRTVIEIETFGVDEATVDRLRAADGVTSVSIEDREQAQVLHVMSPSGTELTQSLLALLNGVSIGRVAAREPTL